MPETAMIWNAILTIAGGSLVWWIRGVSMKIDSIEKEVYDARTEMAKEYASKKDLRVGMDDLAKRFDKLEEKIDTILLKVKVNDQKKEKHMPKVGKKKFPYTAKGKAKAKAYAKKTGKKMKSKKYQKGETIMPMRSTYKKSKTMKQKGQAKKTSAKAMKSSKVGIRTKARMKASRRKSLARSQCDHEKKMSVVWESTIPRQVLS